jgi:hypothetical protein
VPRHHPHVREKGFVNRPPGIKEEHSVESAHMVLLRHPVHCSQRMIPNNANSTT